MNQKFLIKIIVGLTSGCGLIALLIAFSSVFLESDFFDPLFTTCLSLFNFGCGAVIGLIGSLFVGE